MPEYIGIEIDDDQASIREQITDSIVAVFPDWLPVRGGLIYLLADGVAFVISELYAVFTLLTTAIFATYLSQVAGVPPLEATPSTATSTWTSSTLSFTVEAGTVVGVEDGAGGLVAFEVASDVSTVDGTAENVELISQEAGEFTAGLTGDVVLLDAEVAAAINPTITLDAATSGGTDGETVDEHIARGSERLQLSSDDVIRGQDAAILARQITGVYRALAIDNFEPPADDTAEGHITVALMDEDGAPVAGGVTTAVQTALDEATILGLTINLVDVEDEAVKVTVVGVAHAGYDEADVADRVEAAVQSFLNPATWGSVPFGDVREWRTQPVVRYLELAQVVNTVEGFDYITSLQVAKQADALGTADVTLGTDPWVVASAGTISVTVNAPS